jgi:hypothetical protein
MKLQFTAAQVPAVSPHVPAKRELKVGSPPIYCQYMSHLGVSPHVPAKRELKVCPRQQSIERRLATCGFTTCPCKEGTESGRTPPGRHQTSSPCGFTTCPCKEGTESDQFLVWDQLPTRIIGSFTTCPCKEGTERTGYPIQYTLAQTHRHCLSFTTCPCKEGTERLKKHIGLRTIH